MHNPIKDSRLWLQSALTIGGTVLVSIALNGALAAPTALGDPQPSPSHIVQSESPYTALSAR